MTITGPFTATGPGDTPSRRRDLHRAGRRARRAEAACARQIIATLARRAYRRPVTDADLQPHPRLLQAGAPRRHVRDAASRAALQLILASPKFVFRVEARSRRTRRPARVYRVSDLELASRLSFFLWSSIPDDELLRRREPGQAERPGRARAAGAPHAGRSASRRRWSATSPASGCSCATSKTLAAELRRVSRLRRQPAPGVPARDGAVLREHHPRGPQRPRPADGRLHVRQRAAGAPLRHPEHLRQPVPPRDASPTRRARVCSARAASWRSPRTRRGRRRSCAASGSSRTFSARRRRRRRPTCRRSRKTKPGAAAEDRCASRWREHRANPVCASCHKVMDPIGFALENFDAVGAWRTRDAGAPHRRVGRAGRRHHGRRRGRAAPGAAAAARTCSSAR